MTKVQVNSQGKVYTINGKALLENVAEINNQDKTITENGSYTADTGYTGLGTVTVNVTATEPDLVDLTVNENGTYTHIGHDGYDNVVVNVPSYPEPTGTISITSNGIVNVKGYASANVNVAGGGSTGLTRGVDSNGVYNFPPENFSFALPSNARDVGTRAMQYAFYKSTTLTSLDCSSLTDLSGEGAMSSAYRECTNLVSVDFSNLIRMTGNQALYYGFYACENLEFIDFSNLTTVGGSNTMYYAFYNCAKLTNVAFPKLTTVNGTSVFSDTFYNCNSLTTVSFPELSDLSTGSQAFYYAFESCKNLKHIYFNKLNSQSFGSNQNQFNSMLYQVTGCTVHFPSNLQSVIGSWTSVTKGFSGTDTVILYDLPATS